MMAQIETPAWDAGIWAVLTQFLHQAAPSSTGMNAESDILREKLGLDRWPVAWLKQSYK